MRPSDNALLFPRRLAIQLLSHAQRLAPGEPLRGALFGSAPPALEFRPGEPGPDAKVWASVVALADGAESAPAAAAGKRVMSIGLDTKGVLQLRCWEAEGDRLRERDLRIAD